MASQVDSPPSRWKQLFGKKSDKNEGEMLDAVLLDNNRDDYPIQSLKKSYITSTVNGSMTDNSNPETLLDRLSSYLPREPDEPIDDEASSDVISDWVAKYRTESDCVVKQALKHFKTNQSEWGTNQESVEPSHLKGREAKEILSSWKKVENQANKIKYGSKMSRVKDPLPENSSLLSNQSQADPIMTMEARHQLVAEKRKQRLRKQTETRSSAAEKETIYTNDTKDGMFDTQDLYGNNSDPYRIDIHLSSTIVSKSQARLAKKHYETQLASKILRLWQLRQLQWNRKRLLRVRADSYHRDRTLQRAFTHLIVCWTKQRTKRSQYKQAQKHWETKLLHGLFSKWSSFAAQQVYEAQALYAQKLDILAIQFHEGCLQRKVFTSWKDWGALLQSERRTEQEASAEKSAVKHHSHRCLSRAFLSWELWRKEQIELRQRAAKKANRQEKLSRLLERVEGKSHEQSMANATIFTEEHLVKAETKPEKRSPMQEKSQNEGTERLAQEKSTREAKRKADAKQEEKHSEQLNPSEDKLECKEPFSEMKASPTTNDEGCLLNDKPMSLKAKKAISRPVTSAQVASMEERLRERQEKRQKLKEKYQQQEAEKARKAKEAEEERQLEILVEKQRVKIEKQLKSRQEKEKIAEQERQREERIYKWKLAQLHCVRSTLKYYGFQPWKAQTQLKRFALTKAMNWHNDWVMQYRWQRWCDYTKQNLQERLDFARCHFGKQTLSKCIQGMKEFHQSLMAKEVAIRQQRLFDTKQAIWKYLKRTEFENRVERKVRVRKVQEQLTFLKQRRIWVTWVQLAREGKAERLRQRKKAETWKKVQGWLEDMETPSPFYLSDENNER